MVIDDRKLERVQDKGMKGNGELSIKKYNMTDQQCFRHGGVDGAGSRLYFAVENPLCAHNLFNKSRISHA